MSDNSNRMIQQTARKLQKILNREFSQQLNRGINYTQSLRILEELEVLFTKNIDSEIQFEDFGSNNASQNNLKLENLWKFLYYLEAYDKDKNKILEKINSLLKDHGDLGKPYFISDDPFIVNIGQKSDGDISTLDLRDRGTNAIFAKPGDGGVYLFNQIIAHCLYHQDNFSVDLWSSPEMPDNILLDAGLNHIGHQMNDLDNLFFEANQRFNSSNDKHHVLFIQGIAGVFHEDSRASKVSLAYAKDTIERIARLGRSHRVSLFMLNSSYNDTPQYDSFLNKELVNFTDPIVFKERAKILFNGEESTLMPINK